MAENLNEYFSSVFTREDISADYLGQLIFIPKMVTKKKGI